MSDRQEYVRLPRKADTERVSIACRRLRRALDYADDREFVVLEHNLKETGAQGDDAIAWMTLCFLLADTCDIDSIVLSTIARGVRLDEQGVLF